MKIIIVLGFRDYWFCVIIGNLFQNPEPINQCNILTANDKAFLRSFSRPLEGIDGLLMIVPRKGNILDIFIGILKQKRENQEATKRLVLKRFQLHGRQRVNK